MPTDEYSNALEKALSDLHQRIQTRDLLKAEIAGLRETVRVLSTLVPLPVEKQQEVAKLLATADYATPNLTDAIRTLLLRISPQEMTAIEVRNALEDSSDFDDCSLSACHAALKRMLSDGEIERGTIKNGKASYRKVIPVSTDRMGMLVNLLGRPTLPRIATSNLVDYTDAGKALKDLNPESLPDSTRAAIYGPAHPVDKLVDRTPKAPRPPNWKGGVPPKK
jgi:hypothetical protein